MPTAPVTLRTALTQSSLDARRGVVRLHYQLLASLGARAWDVLELTGDRSTGAIAAFSAPGAPVDVIYVDDLTLTNCGVQPGGSVGVRLVSPQPATSIQLSAPDGFESQPQDASLRFALLGKVVSAGDRVGLLPQDFTGSALPPATAANVLGQLAAAFGGDWQQDLLMVASIDPPGTLVRVTMATTLMCTPGSSASTASASSASSPSPGPAGGVAETVPAPVSPDSLPGLEKQISALREWLDLGFNHRPLLARMGAVPTMGVLITGPPGSGKRAVVEAAAAGVGASVLRLWGPALGRIEPAEAVKALTDAVRRAEAAAPCVLLIEQVHEIAPRDDANPLTSVVLEYVKKMVTAGLAGIVCSTDRPEATTPDLRLPGLLDHEISITLPNRADRRRILEVHTRPLPLAADIDLDEIARRTPGFVAADLKALCHEAALRAAQRLSATPVAAPGPAGAPDPASEASTVLRADFDAALEVVRPSAMDGRVELGGITLEDVGDMVETKRMLTESVIWPLTYPETFERLGVPAPHGALLYGPPGCGKTFLVKALVAEAAANFISVRGAELLSKWVGESERGVRELFRRARSAAPSIIFFDEIDALAPTRGSDQNGTTDRVVAQLLTELDGIEELRDVYVLAATNRPELVDAALLRPGRLDTMIYVPPPDADARAAILRAAVRRMPVEPGVDLETVARGCEGFSAADLQSLCREAAMTAMRENIASPSVTAAHFAAALRVVRPSLQPAQVAALEAFAHRRAVVQ
ncbi:MAG: AAA family ATPase [Actinomycetota bacterium]